MHFRSTRKDKNIQLYRNEEEFILEKKKVKATRDPRVCSKLIHFTNEATEAPERSQDVSVSYSCITNNCRILAAYNKHVFS